ncbi:hypothetical protein BDN72DRAFT_345499 [Pluteus cervinus]|uniref:Uncharacterized protein n=1 Tax=Pluteus cervinus TaxID=181527 RepID=A0ACD3AAP9_9AGAR|nr:hypothetical protein BDN72DRAFT_345499 [Pluteus cervinus]
MAHIQYTYLHVFLFFFCGWDVLYYIYTYTYFRLFSIIHLVREELAFICLYLDRILDYGFGVLPYVCGVYRHGIDLTLMSTNAIG